MTSLKLNKMARRIHKIHIKWWQDINTGKRIERNKNALIMLVVTELAEAAEGVRKDLMDDKLKHRKMEEVEMADAYIRLMDYAGGFKMELEAFSSYAVPDDKLEAIFSIVKILSPNRLSVSMALCQIEAYCEHFDLDLFGAIEEKLAFNQKRKDHTHAARRGKHGKKF